MKLIKLTPIEFYQFKQLAQFIYYYVVKEGFVLVEADIKALEVLGY